MAKVTLYAYIDNVWNNWKTGLCDSSDLLSKRYSEKKN